MNSENWPENLDGTGIRFRIVIPGVAGSIPVSHPNQFKYLGCAAVCASSGFRIDFRISSGQ